MKSINLSKTLLPLAGLALAAGSVSAANVIVNGDFETGDLTGWSLTGSGSTVSSTDPLAGLESAIQTPNGTSKIEQSFTTFTTAATTSFIFSATDPGGSGDRSMNVTFGESGSDDQINLRLVDDGADGDGDIQAFSGSWNTVLPDAVTFGTTTTFSLTINGYGGSFSYDLNVGGSTATGLTAVQGSALGDFNHLSFVNAQLASGSSVKFDNVLVDVVPEPSAAALLGLGGLALLRRRRR